MHLRGSRWLFIVILLFFLNMGETKNPPETPLSIPAFNTFTYVLYGFSSSRTPFHSIPTPQIPAWLKQHGINAVFVLPDEKSNVLTMLRNNGIACFQEFTVFAGRSLYHDHPEWRPIMSNGAELPPDGWYYGLSPNPPKLRQKRLDEFRNRLKNHQIQGIWLDFIRYPIHWEKPNPSLIDTDFSPASLQQFERFAHVQLPSGTVAEKAGFILKNHPSEWVNFKVETIRSWVEEAAAIRDEIRPDVVIGLFGIPWRSTDWKSAIRTIAGQDFSVLAPWVDIFSPMVYHRLCGQTPAWIHDVTLSIKEQTGKLIWPVIQATSEPGTMSSDEFLQAVQRGAVSSGTGVILFTATHIENEQRWQQVQTASDTIHASLNNP